MRFEEIHAIGPSIVGELVEFEIESCHLCEELVLGLNAEGIHFLQQLLKPVQLLEDSVGGFVSLIISCHGRRLPYLRGDGEDDKGNSTDEPELDCITASHALTLGCRE